MSEWEVPAEPERSSTSRYVQPKNWLEVTEGSGNKRRTFQRFKFRILGAAISGALAWTEANKPVRARTEADLKLPEGAKWKLNDKGDHKGERQLPKTFWAFPVWDYELKEVRIMEITQAVLRDCIRAYATNADWGSPLGYDLTATREGKGLETTYAMIASPKSAMPAEAQAAYDKLVADGFDLSRLYDGGDPFPSATGEQTLSTDACPF